MRTLPVGALPSKDETLSQWWSNAGPSLQAVRYGPSLRISLCLALLALGTKSPCEIPFSPCPPGQALSLLGTRVSPASSTIPSIVIFIISATSY